MNILITGSSSGFGKLIANSLLADGHNVAAAMRDATGRNLASAEALRKAGAIIVEIDVTEESSVNSGVADAVDQLGSLDVLINNAGIGVHGLQEAFTIDDFQKLFDVNLFGVQRMNRAVIPHMRRQGHGLLVYVSSLLGRVTLPFYGPYNASKWALEALAENYRSELSVDGIGSALIEPGGFKTDFMSSLLRPGDTERLASLSHMSGAPEQAFAAFDDVLAQNPQQDPQLVADAVLAVVNAAPGERPFRTEVDTLGMAAAIGPYNRQLDDVTRGLYEAFGMGDMLSAKRPASV
ncbi:MAG: SDR family oxidoreductase [Pseudomonadota bacterium]|nr:SDR family oxidoreductase [Pseudomonadota bacterium]